MSDTKNVVFRSSMGGYNKSDVNEYLVRLSAEVSERENAIRERAERAEREAAELQEKIDEYSSELEGSREEIEAKNAELAELSATVLELEKRSSEIDSEEQKAHDEHSREQETIISKQFEEIDSLKAQIEDLKAKLAEKESENARYDDLARKAQLYDKTSANIGEAIISAKKTAEEIVASAHEEARLLTEKAQKELADKRKTLEETSRHALESIYGKLSSAASESRKDVAGASAYASRVLEEALDNIRDRNENVNIKLKNTEESLRRSIKDDLETVVMISSTRPSSQKKPSPEQAKRLKR